MMLAALEIKGVKAMFQLIRQAAPEYAVFLMATLRRVYLYQRERKMKKPIAAVLSVTIALAGCATSSGVMSVGPDTYLITTAADAFRGGGSGAQQVALSEAQQHCIKLNKELLVTNMETSPFVGGGKSFDVTFRCLVKGDPELARPTFKKTPDVVIEDRRK